MEGVGTVTQRVKEEPSRILASTGSSEDGRVIILVPLSALKYTGLATIRIIILRNNSTTTPDILKAMSNSPAVMSKPLTPQQQVTF